MAKAKRKISKRKKKTASKVDVAVVVLIFFSILLAVLIYTKSGFIGVKLNEILGGMLGIVQYALPIGIFVIALKIACIDKEEVAIKLLQYGILLLSLSIVFSIFQISKGDLQSSKELSEVLKDAYYLGSQGEGGGALRSTCCNTTCKTFRRCWCSYIMFRNSNYTTSIYIWNKYVRYNTKNC